MRRFLIALVICVLAIPGTVTFSYAADAKPLQIFSIDVEGGAATLIVDAQGESLLIDTGWAGFNNRDANRIAAAAKAAGIAKIDYVMITHYHADHVGGVSQLASAIKIGTFVDHGPNQEDSDVTRQDYANYEKLIAAYKRMSVKPGNRIPFKGMTVQVLAAAGDQIMNPLPGAGQPNPLCAAEPPAPLDASENARSIGVLVTSGKFRFLAMGDLVKIKERGLVCPNNLIGTVDLYLTTHHGLDQSNAKAFVDAVHPRVAIMNNGARKGGSPAAWQIVHDSPGLQDLWQLHRAVASGNDHNVADNFIANPDEQNDAGNYIVVQAQPDGTFTVTNSRNNFAKTYTK